MSNWAKGSADGDYVVLTEPDGELIFSISSSRARLVADALLYGMDWAHAPTGYPHTVDLIKELGDLYAIMLKISTKEPK